MIMSFNKPFQQIILALLIAPISEESLLFLRTSHAQLLEILMANMDMYHCLTLLHMCWHLIQITNQYQSDLFYSGADKDEITYLSEGMAVANIIDHARKICKEDVICPLIAFEWSDDFDPALSTKASHKSCWVKTVTIMPYVCNKTDNGCTFPVAIGNKKVVTRQSKKCLPMD
jgi:hypothetical protein